MSRRDLFLAEPDFRAELGQIVNIECLIEIFRLTRDRRDLEAKVGGDRWLRLAQGELNADFCLRRRGAAWS